MNPPAGTGTVTQKSGEALSRAAAGSTVRITALRGGRDFQHRLLGMGLTVGSEIDVIRGGHGKRQPVLIGKHGSRIMIGHGMADKIIVCALSRPGRAARPD